MTPALVVKTTSTATASMAVMVDSMPPVTVAREVTIIAASKSLGCSSSVLS